MYTFPFWLLSSSLTRNAAMADKIEEDLMLENERHNVTEAVPDEVRHLWSLQRKVDKLFLETARSKLSIFNEPMPDIDKLRVRDKMMGLLRTTHRRTNVMEHQWQAPDFFDDAAEDDRWEASPVLSKDSPKDWNGLLMGTLSDLHRHVYLFIEGSRQSMLLRSSPEYDMLTKIREMEEALDHILPRLAEYCRFLSSL